MFYLYRSNMYLNTTCISETFDRARQKLRQASEKSDINSSTADDELEDESGIRRSKRSNR